MSPTRTVVYVALCLALVSGTASASTRRHDTDVRKDLDLTASSQPSMARPTVADTATDVSWSARPVAKVDTVATSSATCDQCTGDSAALEILYLARARRADLDNSAIAWAQCQACRATALSVQVVVLRGAPTVAPNNRALAVNAACTGCESTAAAFQLVVVAPRADRLAPASIQGIQSWFDEEAAALRALAPATRGRHSLGDPYPDALRALATLETLVNSDLGSETSASDVVVD